MVVEHAELDICANRRNQSETEDAKNQDGGLRVFYQNVSRDLGKNFVSFFVEVQKSEVDANVAQLGVQQSDE